MTEPYVMRMRPHLVRKIWGGRKLADIFGKDLPDPHNYGESWEVADLPEGQSIIDNGDLKDQPLRAAVQSWGERLIGPGRTQFPLLVKLLDAQQDLSIQVHPDAEYAAGHPGSFSKDESWLVLHTDPGGSILYGFSQPRTAAEVASALEGHTIVDLLRRVTVADGDVFRVAPGTVHAICAGVSLLEIQEPSDTTFRVFDYQRPGLDGQPRQLHLQQAQQVMSLKPAQPEGLDGSALVAAPRYRIEKRDISGDASWDVDPASPQILHVVDGQVECNGVTLQRWQTAVIPAALGRVSCFGNATVVAASAGTQVFG